MSQEEVGCWGGFRKKKRWKKSEMDGKKSKRKEIGERKVGQRRIRHINLCFFSTENGTWSGTFWSKTVMLPWLIDWKLSFMFGELVRIGAWGRGQIWHELVRIWSAPLPFITNELFVANQWDLCTFGGARPPQTFDRILSMEAQVIEDIKVEAKLWFSEWTIVHFKRDANSTAHTLALSSLTIELCVAGPRGHL